MSGSLRRTILFLSAFLVAVTVSSAPLSHFTGVHASAEIVFIYGVELSFNGDDAVAGDEIGVFTAGGVLCGATRIQGPGGFPAISVYKDDPLTPEIDGAHSGDSLVFKFWRAAENKEYGGNDIEYMYIEKKDGAGKPYWTMGNDVYRVDLRVGNAAGDSIRLTLYPGWNLLSFPFSTTAQGPAETILVRDDGSPAITGNAWLWNAAAQQYVKQTGGFSAKRGFWVYSSDSAPTVVARIAGPTAGAGMTLAPGWNLVGPAMSAPKTEVPGLDGADGTIWRWNAQTQQYEAVPADRPLDRGTAYWVLIMPQSPAARGAPGSADECRLLSR